jgi:hypothetical protein
MLGTLSGWRTSVSLVAAVCYVIIPSAWQGLGCAAFIKLSSFLIKKCVIAEFEKKRMDDVKPKGPSGIAKITSVVALSQWSLQHCPFHWAVTEPC